MLFRCYLLLNTILMLYMGTLVYQQGKQVTSLKTELNTVIRHVNTIEQSVDTTKLNFIIENQDSIDLELSQHRDLILENQYAIAKRLSK